MSKESQVKMDVPEREERKEREEKLESQATTDDRDRQGNQDVLAETEETAMDAATSSPCTVGPIEFQHVRQTLTFSGKASVTKTSPVQPVSLNSVSCARL